MKIKKFGKMSSIFEYSILKLGHMEIFMNMWEKNEIKKFFNFFAFTLSSLTFAICLIKMGKNFMPKRKMRMKKFARVNLIFEFSISKLGYINIFMKIWERKMLTHFLGHFWPIEVKMKLQIKKIEKMSLIFEFSKSKLGDMAIFMKICRKKNFGLTF